MNNNSQLQHEIKKTQKNTRLFSVWFVLAVRTVQEYYFENLNTVHLVLDIVDNYW